MDYPQCSERLGWTTDAKVFAATAGYLTEACALLGKYCVDLYMEQKHHGGAVPHVVPSFGKKGSCSAWGDAATIIPWTLYLFFGDESILHRQSPA